MFSDGRNVTNQIFEQAVDDELTEIRSEVGELVFEPDHYEQAATLLRQIVAEDKFEEFLTLPAYEQLN
ncbi:MAG: hypothetical protein KZQ60_06545 [Candidatus Thiodiazotropha sp. (ex Lucinoma aequizonata)]|nr:hypothetical protein [Candidatus Thiodiazotropha sp. (ex Lucinoma aequizonata)]MCU7898084.1 hypothetical protein [Candidatus Thiodiazotropha sp. (ex Lucinoma aequizonata)]